VTELADFLKQQLGTGGDWNCSTLAADWCVSLGYPDFAARWRAIVDPVECQDVSAAAGGLVRLWEQGIGDKLQWADEPWQAGDIAVVGLADLEAGAIFTGERWALKLPRGLAFASVDQVEAICGWRP